MINFVLGLIIGGTIGIIGFAALMIGRNTDQDGKIAELRKEVHFQKLIASQLEKLCGELIKPGIDVKA